LVLYGLIADDITGASDVGVKFKKHGMETVVLIRVENLKNLSENIQVIVVDTESRNDSSEVAYRKVRDAVKILRTLGVSLVYKKIDSTLRGNIGAELDAVMDELNINTVIVAPAFPANKRVTINGYHLVDQKPLEETSYARDPFNPVNESDVVTLIQRQTRRNVGLINLSIVRSGVRSLKREVRRQKEIGNEIIVVDAAVQDDLKIIARAVMDYGALPCGSAGLAEEISQILNPPKANLVLAVSGSVNEVTMRQVSVARRELNASILEPNLIDILRNMKEREEERKRLLMEADQAIAEKRDIIIILAESEEHLLKVKEIGENRGMTKMEISEKMLSFLSDIFKLIMERSQFAGLVLTGGDTALRMINTMGAYGIRIEKEIMPGIPIGKVIGGKHEGTWVITKAGGFGDEDAILKSIRFLKRRVI